MSGLWCFADAPRRVEVVSSEEELAIAFGASAVSHESVVELSLRPTLRWSTYGKFYDYTLYVVPKPVDPTTVRAAYKERLLDAKVWVSDSPSAKVSVAKRDLDRAFIDVAFSPLRKADEPGLNLLIPLSLVRTLLAKKPNQPPEPTALSVTPRAGARVAPASTVAHL